MTYRIESLSFGSGSDIFDFPVIHKSKNIENYIKQLEGDVKTRKFIVSYENEDKRKDYFNHLKIIPVQF